MESGGWRESCDQIEKNFDDTLKKNESSKGLYQFIWIIIPGIMGEIAIVKKIS